MTLSFVRVLALLVPLSASFAGSTAGSTILFDELNTPNAGNDILLQFGPLYQSFSTGASAAALSDVVASLTVGHDFDPNPNAVRANGRLHGHSAPNVAGPAGAGLTVGLYSDAGETPGALIATIGTLLDSELPGGQASKNFDFPVNPPIALTANTRYWIGFVTTTGSVAGLNWTADLKGPGGATEFYYFKHQVHSDSEDGPYQMRMTAIAPTTPVPTIERVFDQAAATTKFTPGMPIQIVGTGFGSSATDSATVTIGTLPAPILTFINSTNLIVQIPVDAPLGPTFVMVTYQGQPSSPSTLTLVAIAPEIEPFQSSDGSSFYDASNNPITAAHPAIPNTSVYLLAIGLGPTNPPQVTNTKATVESPTTQTVQVLIGTKIVTPDYAGLWVNGTPGFYQVSFTLPGDTALGNQDVSLLIAGLTSNKATLVVAAPIPVINAIVNGATFAAGNNPQAANSFVSIFGLNFGTKNTTGNIFPATSFEGVSVLVNGTPVPLYFVVGTGGQINIVLPSELSNSGSATVEVKTSEGTSAPFQFTLAADSVGIFRIPDPSTPTRANGAVLFSNTAWKVMPLSMAAALGLPSCASVTTASVCGKPAKEGDSLQIYLTGLGKATANGDPNGSVLATGSLAPTDGSVLYKTVDTPIVKINGVVAPVLFSGIAPGNAGQYQININVPVGALPPPDDPKQPWDSVKLQITMPDGSTDTVTIALTDK